MQNCLEGLENGQETDDSTARTTATECATELVPVGSSPGLNDRPDSSLAP